MTRLDAYFELYEATARAIASVDPLIQVGGPATQNLMWLPDFVNFTGAGRRVPAGFVSTHYYPTEMNASEITRTAWEDNITAAAAVAAAAGLPLVVTEMSAGLANGAYDSPFAAAFLVHAAAAFLGAPNAPPTLSWWTFSDVFEESGFQSETWINTYGLQTKYGVPKPAYRAFEMLAALPATGVFVDADAGGAPRRPGSGPAARCTATVGTVDIVTALDARLGTTLVLHALVTNFNANVVNATDPSSGLPIATASGVTVTFVGLPAGAVLPASASLSLLDSTHAWARRAFVANGAPLYPTPAQVAAELEASLVTPTPVPLRDLGGGRAAFTLPDLEPYATARVLIEVAVQPPRPAEARVAIPPAPAFVAVNWSSILRPLQTVAAHQTVVNPVTTRESPLHDAVFEKIALLRAPFQRYVPWLPYPRLSVAALEPPSTGSLCAFVNSGGKGNPWSATLDCGAQGAGSIDGVVFAQYGSPSGFCNALRANASCARDVSAAVAAACVGRPSCTLASNDETFGAAPCAGSDLRLAVEVTCSNKSVATFTSWDFAALDAGVLDFMAAAGGRSVVINFSTLPNWLFNSSDRTYVPDDPLAVVWTYSQGKALRDPTGRELGDFFGRLIAHYVAGGFEDEGGRFVPGHRLTFDIVEILNEPDYERGIKPREYVALYDAIVAGVLRWAPAASASMRFMGLAVNNLGRSLQWAEVFLNRSEHAPGIPVGGFSFHHYGASASRDGGVAGADYEAIFPSADTFVASVAALQAVRSASDFPDALMDADEVGVILPDDNNSTHTAAAPGFPALYFNAAAASFAYIFGAAARLGLDVLGESQMVGYPLLPFPRGPPLNDPAWAAAPQFPSVTLLSWGGAFASPGDGTARFWALKLLVDSFRATGPAGGGRAPADADALVDTAVAPLGAGVFAQAFVERGGGGPARKLLVVSKSSQAQTVWLAGAAGGQWIYVDSSTGFAPAVNATLAADSWSLAPFALGVLTLPAA